MGSSGYVYVIAFEDGTLKVGRSQDAETRLRTHGQTAKGFGLSVTGKWSSPEHAGWEENEDRLKRLAEELGGIRRSDEWFTEVDFGELVARADGLAFPAPKRARRAASPTSGTTQLPAERKIRATPRWLLEAADWFAFTGIPCEGIPVERAVEELRKRVLSDRRLMNNLADDYVRRSLRHALLAKRPMSETRSTAA